LARGINALPPLIISAGSTSSEIGLVLKPDTLDELSETIISDLAAPGTAPGNAVFGT
jgi:hypothetical protein